MNKHFEDKSALNHVIEKRIKGMSSVSEAHGTEMPGHFSAAFDACRETALFLLILSLLLPLTSLSFSQMLMLLIAFGLGLVAWKAGRSGWLGWARLERLHRLIEQEKYEIEHHRPQEREELIALYEAKGFHGKLLDDVVDVLMADQDRLLKVMLEEEMGLTLQAYEHPLQQTLGAAVGAFAALGLSIIFFYLFSTYGIVIAAFILIGSASFCSATYEGNRQIPAIIWNLCIGALSSGIVYFLSRMFF